MTYEEIVRRRLEINQTRVIVITQQPDFCEYQQVNLERNPVRSENSIIYQRCGGGCRIIKKKLSN